MSERWGEQTKWKLEIRNSYTYFNPLLEYENDNKDPSKKTCLISGLKILFLNRIHHIIMIS